MPVQPGNTNFPQGGPRPVAPAVAYNQQPTNVGFFGAVLPGLGQLAQLAGGVKELIEGDPLKEAQSKHFGALAAETEVRTEANKDKGITDAISSWGTILGKMSRGPQRDNSFQAGIADLKRYGLSEEEARQALQGFAERTALEAAVDQGYSANGVRVPGQQPGQPPPAATGAQGSNPAGGLGADMTVQAPAQPPADPRAVAQGMAPQEAPAKPVAPEGGQRTYPAPGEVGQEGTPAGQNTRGVAAAVSEEMGGTGQAAAQGAANPFAEAESLAGVKPLREPIIRTAFGPVPTPQREFKAPERALVEPGLSPDDVLPITEAYSNPTFTQASQASAAAGQQSVAGFLKDMAAIQIEDAMSRGVAIPSNSLLMMRMDELQAKQYFDAEAAKLGVHHEKAGDLLSMVKLYRFMKTRGEKMDQADVNEVVDLYRENPALLGMHLGIVEKWTGEDALYAGLQTKLAISQQRFEATKATVAGNVQVAGIRAQAQVQSAAIAAEAVNARTNMMWMKWGQEFDQKQVETRIGLVNSAVEALDKKDQRLNELLTDLSTAEGLDPGFKARVQRASALSHGFRAVQQKVADNNDNIRRYQEQINKDYANLPDSVDDLPSDASPRKRQLTEEKIRIRKNIEALEAENQEYSSMLRGDKSLGKMMQDAFSDVMTDPQYQNSKNLTTAGGNTVYGIVDQVRNLSQERAGARTNLDVLQDEGARRNALDQVARNWFAAPPSFEQFINTQMAGHPLRVHVTDMGKLAEMYADFREMVFYYQRERKAKDRDGYRMPEKKNRDYRAGGTGSPQNRGRQPGSAPAQPPAPPTSPYGGFYSAPPYTEDDSDAWGSEED